MELIACVIAVLLTWWDDRRTYRVHREHVRRYNRRLGIYEEGDVIPIARYRRSLVNPDAWHPVSEDTDE